MRKRLLVTGYGGLVAGNVIQLAGSPWQVTAISRSEIAAPRRADVRHVRLDLGDAARLRRAFRQVQPEAVIHTAAIAGIDYCQSHQAEAEAINVGVTGHLVRLCDQTAARLVFCSTDTVFSGGQGNYREDDPPDPVNFYGETKVRAEQLVLAQSQRAVVARLALVLGLSPYGAGNSFLTRLRQQLEAGSQVECPTDEIRTPVDAITLAHALLELAGSDETGILHLAGSTRLDRYDMAVQIARRLGYPAAMIKATDASEIAGRVPRPADATLDNSRAQQRLRTPMRTFADGLQQVLA